MNIDEENYLLPVLCGYLTEKNYPAFTALLKQCLSVGIAPGDIREAVIQVYLHAGYPAALEGLFILNQELGGKTEVFTEEAINEGTLENWRSHGEKTCKIVYRGNYDKLVENVRKLSPDFANWMVIEGYGKVLSRPQLPLKLREFISIAVLMAGWYPRQLHSHLKGALNAGAAPEEIEMLLDRLSEVSPEKSQMSRELWEKILFAANS